MVKARSLLKGKIPTSRSFSPARSKKKMTTTDAKADSPVAAVTDHMTKLQAAGSWDTDELSYEKHHAGEAQKGEPADGRPSLEDHHRGIFSIRKLHKQHKEKTHPLDWGYPGELSKEEVDCFVSDFGLFACAQFFGDAVRRRPHEARRGAMTHLLVGTWTPKYCPVSNKLWFR